MNDWRSLSLEVRQRWLASNKLKLDYAHFSWDELPDPIKGHWLVSQRRSK